MSEPPPGNRLATKSRNSGVTDHSHGAAWMLPNASTNRPGTSDSASAAASAWSMVCRLCDQSTDVVTPASMASIALSRFPA